MTAGSPDVLVEHTDAVLRVTFNSPQTLNALTRSMLTSAADAVEAAAADPTVRVITLTGAGRAFSAGANLLAAEADDATGTTTIDEANRLTQALCAAPKPVVAAVNGAAVGVGCSFVLAADLSVARESAYFLQAFARVGLMPDGGATALFPAAIGRARAMRMAMLGERIPANAALQWGLISHVEPDDAFEASIEQLVSELAVGPTAAYGYTKRAINGAALASLPAALDIEREGQSILFDTDDLAEGVAAFRDKRAPKFAGR